MAAGRVVPGWEFPSKFYTARNGLCTRRWRIGVLDLFILPLSSFSLLFPSRRHYRQDLYAQTGLEQNTGGLFYLVEISTPGAGAKHGGNLGGVLTRLGHF